MRKLISWLLLIVLSALVMCGAYAEESFRLAGFDHADTGHDWQTNFFFERLEAMTGQPLLLEQYKSEEAWAAAKAAMFAEGGDMPDALFKANLTTQETERLYAQGKIIDLKPYLAEYAPDLWALLQGNESWMEAVTLPGTDVIAALPAIDELQFNNAMWINQKWLKKLGLQMPTTAEELADVLRAFRDGDPNGNGKDDEVPLTFTSLWDLRFLGHAFGINANDYYLTADENGIVSEVLTTDANRELLTWLHELWSEGLLDENGFTGLRDVSVNTDQDAPIIYGVMFAPTPVQLVPVAAMTDYVLLPPMTFEGKQIYRDLTGDVIRGAFAITSACKDPAKLVEWVNTLYTEQGFILAEAGLEGEDFDWNDDGTWLWSVSNEALDGMLKESTIRSGVSMPGMASVDFQMKIDDAATRHVVANLAALKELDSLPLPLVYLTEAQQARVDEIIYDLGMYAEYRMVWFVTGDVPLTDESWAAFCQGVKEQGIDELVSIFQSALNDRQ